MSFALDVCLLLLLSIANGTPVVAQNILGARFSHPIDCGAKLSDAQPLFGASKSIRGIVLSVLATTAAAPLFGLSWQTGTLIAAAAMFGDLCSSFLKRRMRMPASSMALGLDQLPESLFPLLICAFFLPLSAADIALIVAVFFAGELLLSRILFKFHLRNRPY